MFKEFKKFIARGNVIDLAVGVIMGGAFGKIVSSLVDNIIMPLVGLVIGGVDFSSLSVTVKGASIKYGLFIQNVVDFLIVAFCIFAALKLILSFKTKFESLKKKEEVIEEAVEEAVAEPSNEEKLLTEIRDLLKEKK